MSVVPEPVVPEPVVPERSSGIRASLAPAWERVAAAPVECVCTVTGPPGSGKTTALAARALRLAQDGPALVVCSHESGVRAFREALAAVRVGANVADVRVDTAPGHCLRWLRSHYALAAVRPDVRPGGDNAAQTIVREAASGLLDMSWPELRDIDLNIPFLSRPDSFLDEAAALVRLLRGARVTPAEFEASCAAGIAAFYGDEVEAALAKCRDSSVRARASKRGREALSVGPAVLQSQRRAERDLATVLGRLYREYLRVARTASRLSDEDIVDETLRWLTADVRSSRAITSEYAGVLVDDAEDAYPGVADLLVQLAASGMRSVTIAGWPDAAIGGLKGRRSALDALTPDERLTLPLTAALPVAASARYASEDEEVARVAEAIADLMRGGVAPADIAVLTRSADAAAVYAELLSRRGLPVDAPLDRFLAPKEIADWLALAAVVDDPSDHAHMLRVLASPLVGLADASIFALCEDPAAVTQLALEVGVGDEHRRPGAKRQHTALARNMLEGNADARLPEETRAIVVRFRQALAAWRTSLAGLTPPAALARLGSLGGFRQHWDDAPSHRRARIVEDAQRVLEAVTADAFSIARSMRELVEAFEDGAVPVRPAARSRLAIACDTIAGAKGERWPHVFVVGLAHERFPRIYVPRGLAFSRTYGLIARENVAPGAAQTAKFAWYYARFAAKARYLDEERRALQYGLARGSVAASATGFGAAPRWAQDFDLLASLDVKAQAGSAEN